MTCPGAIRGVLGVTVRLISDGELSRLDVLRDLVQRRLTTGAAAQLLVLPHRQVCRLLKAYRTEGAGPDLEAAWLSEQRRKPEEPAMMWGTRLPGIYLP
jgi:hypothetical protein